MTRNEAIDVLKANYPDAHYSELREAVDLAIKVLEEPERKKGFWEWVDDMDYRCSVCHKYAYGCLGEVLSGHYKYCPYCGAAMEGEEDDEDD